MAEIAVTFLFHKLDSFLKDKAQLLRGAQGDFEHVRGKLQHMEAFLRVADSNEDNHPHGLQLKVWVEQVREVAYDTEDVIDEFLLRLALHHGHGFYASLNKIYCFIKNLKAHIRIASDLQGLKNRISSTYDEAYKSYSSENNIAAASASNRAGNTRLDSRRSALLLEQEDLVGIDKPKKELISWLAKGSPGREVIPVFGMGGLGKTTLVKQVYMDAAVRKHFKIYVWVIVSQFFEEEELLIDMVRQIYTVIRKSVTKEVKDMKTDELKLRIKELLQRSRYLIVLDDVWKTNVWDSIKLALPNNNCSSRVIVTTRIEDVATSSCRDPPKDIATSSCRDPPKDIATSSCRDPLKDVATSSCRDPPSRVFNLKPLAEEDYWSLFCRKTFRAGSCPAHLQSICASILRKCGGLPLAVVAISGVLAAKNVGVMDEWVNISDNLGIKIQDGVELGLEDMKKVLSLSFNDLQYHLKYCFLYLSMFPEDHLIERMRLIRLWIAEGFVIVKEGSRQTPEELAEDYFKELLNRSLIQVADRSSDGRVITCRIHDLLREIIISKSREQNFAAVAKEDVKWPEKVRRLSVINNLQDGEQRRAFPKLRSFLAFYMVNPITDFSAYGFRLLNVLELEGTPLEVFPGEVVKLCHLKYLSFRNTKIKVIPKSIEKLQNLETLDLKHTFVIELPVEIKKLKKLRHLLVYHYEHESYARFNSKFGFKALVEIGCLQSLQKLCFIEVNQGSNLILEELGKLTQLIRLGIIKFRRENGASLCSSLVKLTKLRALSVSSVETNEIIDLSQLSSPPPLLRRLYLTGRIEALPQWISSLQNLAKLFLKWSQLEDDPLVSIQHLPNLVHLEFQQVYNGEVLRFKTGGFQKLNVLGLDKLERLNSVTVEKGAMPYLEKLILQRCKLLLKVPSGIEHLSELKVLEFFDMPARLIMTLYPDERKDYCKVEHIPEV